MKCFVLWSYYANAYPRGYFMILIEGKLNQTLQPDVAIWYSGTRSLLLFQFLPQIDLSFFIHWNSTKYLRILVLNHTQCYIILCSDTLLLYVVFSNMEFYSVEVACSQGKEWQFPNNRFVENSNWNCWWGTWLRPAVS